MVIISSPNSTFPQRFYSVVSIFFSIFFMTFAFLSSRDPLHFNSFSFFFHCHIETFERYKTKDFMWRKRVKEKKNIDTDTPKSFQEIPWQNETLPFVGKFSKATTTIATAILDLTRCRQRLSAPTFQCNVCVCVSRRVDLSVCMRYFFNSTIVSGALSRCSHSPWWLRF